MIAMIHCSNILLNLGRGSQIGQMVHLVFCAFVFFILIIFWYNQKNHVETDGRHYNWVALFKQIEKCLGRYSPWTRP